MAGTRVQPLSARRWAGLLAVLALALCITRLIRPATATAMEMTPAASMAASSSEQSGGANVEEKAASSCPMDAMARDCRLSAHHRPFSAPPSFAARAASPAGLEIAGLADAQRAPPSPASREGPDLHRLCVSRT
ncbi:hypothetical protein [Streptomyces albogriseolus]|uniref:hypothetical protein n=1 Tax=Streptomyces albogriseolus TaxID=1887 RepID=UPI00346091F1